jgi:hypothetical protein
LFFRLLFTRLQTAGIGFGQNQLVLRLGGPLNQGRYRRPCADSRSVRKNTFIMDWTMWRPCRE